MNLTYYHNCRPGLDGIRGLLAYWDNSRGDEAWFCDLLDMYLAAPPRALLVGIK